jgi:hypothetical protein
MLQAVCSANPASANFEGGPAQPKAADPAIWICEPQRCGKNELEQIRSNQPTD